MKTRKKPFALGPGAIISIILHVLLIGYLLHMVRPSLFVPPQKKMIAQIVLEPPPPPPPPPKPPEPPPPKTPPPKIPPPPTPPPPQQIITNAPTPPVETPSVPPPPPPAPPAPPAPVQNKVVTSWPPSYLSLLTSRIGENLQYPPKAARDGQEGTARARITMLRDGTIESVEIMEKTGFVLLDTEAKAVFSRIVKFPPVPADFSPEAESFVFVIPLTFRAPEGE